MLLKREMLSRRLIRIKVFKALFSYVGSETTDLAGAEKGLDRSCDQVRDLYYLMLKIAESLVDVASEKIAAGMRKFHPTEEEANPNLKFVGNRLVKILEEDRVIKDYCSKHKLSWKDYDAFVRKVYASIQTKDYFKDYMSSGEGSLKEDCRLVSCIFQDEFEDNEELLSILEDMSIFRSGEHDFPVLWEDDLAYTLNIIISGLQKTGTTGKIHHPELFAVGNGDGVEDDLEFLHRLFEKSVLHYDEYTELISGKLSNWKADRVVSTDNLLMVMGITEAVSFPTIPTNVTINEYVEISKYYSTPNSRIFVNGILDAIIKEKVASGEIRKTGRGLL